MSAGSVFYFRDLSQNHRPYRQLTLETISRGEAPLWNPARGAGQPLLANPNSLILHPTTLLFFVLPLDLALKLSVILQILLAAFASWLLWRDLGCSRTASLLGAALFAFSGFVVSLGNLLNLLDSAAFMPLTLWLGLRALTRRFAPWGSLAAGSLAVQIAAGEPAILICTLASLGGMHFSHSIARDALPPPAARLGRMTGIVLLAIALAMIQVLPAWELLAASERGAGFDRAETMKWSASPASLAEAFVAGLFGDPTRADVAKFWGGAFYDAGLPLILSLYIGPAGLILAGAGAWAGWRARGRRRLEALLVGGLAAAGAWLALGRHAGLYPALVDLIPPLESARYPVKCFLLTTWAVSLLAARGLDAAAGRRASLKPPTRRIAVALAGSCALAAAAWLIIQAAGIGQALPGSGAGAPARALQLSCLRVAVVSLCCLGALAWPASRLATGGLVVLAVGDLMTAVRHLNPVAPASFYEQPAAVARLLPPDASSSRLWAAPRPKGFAFRTPQGIGLAPDSLAGGFHWDRMTLRNATFFSTGLRFAYDRGNERLDIMPGAALGRLLHEKLGMGMPAEAARRLFEVAGVGRLITYGGIQLPGFVEEARLEGLSDPPVVILRAGGALPRAYVASDIEVRPDLASALLRLRDPSFDPRRSVILEEGTVPAGASPGPITEARILEESALGVTIAASSPAAGYLVLADTFHPGWEARVDGVPERVVRANGMFRAVSVAAGEHEVRLRYRPASVRSGLMVTAAALLLAALLAVPRSPAGREPGPAR